MDKEDDRAELRRKEGRLSCFIITSPVITGSHTDITRRFVHRLKLCCNENLISTYFPVCHHTKKISPLGYCCFCLWALKFLLFLLRFSSAYLSSPPAHLSFSRFQILPLGGLHSLPLHCSNSQNNQLWAGSLLTVMCHCWPLQPGEYTS